MSATAPEQVTVVALVKLRPGAEEAAVEVLRPVIEQTHDEEGCVKYALHRSTADPLQLVLVELWRSQADLDAHFQKPYMGELFTNLADHIAEAPAIHFLGPVPVGDAGKGLL